MKEKCFTLAKMIKFFIIVAILITGSVLTMAVSNAGGVNVEDGSQFTPDQMKKIEKALSFITPGKIPSGLYFSNRLKGGCANKLMVNIGKDIPEDVFTQTVIHETTHVIDDQTNNHKSMDELYNVSDKDGTTDFLINDPNLGPAIRRNSSEDFAYTAEYYFRDSKSVLADALDRAEKGKTLLLQKVLFVMKTLFIKGNNVSFFIDGNAGKAKSFKVSVIASGDIQSINNIDIKDPNATAFNISGLRSLLK